MMEQPSLVINSDDVPGPKYIMWQTKNVPRGVDAGWTVSQIQASNRDALPNAVHVERLPGCCGRRGTGSRILGRVSLAGLHGQIDEFEGTVYRFTVVGGMQVIDPHKDVYTIKE